MPRLLLDTHAFLWFFTEDPKLSGPAQRTIAAGGNEPLLSAACVWEIVIKVSVGRLPIPAPLDSIYSGTAEHQPHRAAPDRIQTPL
jgi:PIN domain nuclease of toxin-antitoxin system